jgi:hypothetical protein
MCIVVCLCHHMICIRIEKFRMRNNAFGNYVYFILELRCTATSTSWLKSQGPSICVRRDTSAGKGKPGRDENRTQAPDVLSPSLHVFYRYMNGHGSVVHGWKAKLPMYLSTTPWRLCVCVGGGGYVIFHAVIMLSLDGSVHLTPMEWLPVPIGQEAGWDPGRSSEAAVEIWILPVHVYL